MPDGLHRLLIAVSRVRAPPGLSWTRSSVGRAGTSVKIPGRHGPNRSGECRRDYNTPDTPVRSRPGQPGESRLIRRLTEGHGPSLSIPRRRKTNIAGECWWDYIGKGRKAERFESAPDLSGMSHLTSSPAPKFNVGECRRDYRVRAPAQAGGRRFDPASGRPDSSVKMSRHASSPAPL